MATWKRYFVTDGRLRSGWRIAGYLLSYIIASFGVQLAIITAYISYRIATGSSVEIPMLLQSMPQWLLALLSLSEFATLLPLTYLWSRYIDRRAFSSLGLQRDRWWLWDLAMGIVLGSVQMALIFGIEWAGGWITVRPTASLGPDRLAFGGAIAVAFFVLAAFNEELVFRGYLQTNLQEGAGTWVAMVVSGILFAIAHALNPNFGGLPFLNIMLVGLVFSYARSTTGNLWLPIGYHFSWNLTQGPILGLPVSGMQRGSLLHTIDRSTAVWLTGGSFGPEGGLLCTAVLLTTFPLLWLWSRHRCDHQLV